MNIDKKDYNLLHFYFIDPLNNYAYQNISGIPEFDTAQNNYMELHIYSKDEPVELLFSDYNVLGWQFKSNGTSQGIYLDIHNNFRNHGIYSGVYRFEYNFLKKIFHDENNPVFISQISPSRKEIRIETNSTDPIFLEKFNNFKNYPHKDLNGSHIDLALNIGNNKFLTVVNWTQDKITVPDYPHSHILKLYEPLPDDIDVKDIIHLDLILSNPIKDIIELYPSERVYNVNVLSSPNFSLKVDDRIKKETEFNSWLSLVTTDPNVSNAIINKYFAETGSKSAALNIDYSDFSNYVFYSSAERRLKNFKYKLSLIENYTGSLAILNSTLTGSLTSSVEFITNVDKYESRIQDLFKSFDTYEYYLYNNSSSYSWPKDTNNRNYSITSSVAEDWYEIMEVSASDYDIRNINSLDKLIPNHIIEDERTEYYELFVNMIGQHFDTLYLYINNLENIKDRDESLYEGMSKDLIYHVLKSFGWNIYDNNSNKDLWEYSFGYDSSGSYLPYSMLQPSQSLIFVDSQSLSREDITKETWKRILNNTPYLRKTAGTKEGIRALINCFGVPSTELSIREYGGPEKLDRKSYFIRDKFAYALKFEPTSGSRVIITNTDPQTGKHPIMTEFRFKLQDYTERASLYASESYQVLYYNNDQAAYGAGIVANIKPYGYGSIYMTSYDGTNAVKVLEIGSDSNTPLANGKWWTFAYSSESNGSNITINSYLIQSEYNRITQLYSGSATLDQTVLTEYSQSAILLNNGVWNISTITPINITGSNVAYPLNGYVQEFRYWSESLNVSVLSNHALAPTSVQSNNVSGSYLTLIKRFPMGTDLEKEFGTTVQSKHLNKNYTNTVSFEGFTSESFEGYEERYSIEWPDLSANRQISNKVRYENNTLSDILSLQSRSETSAYDMYPLDSSKLGVYFSPTNEVNEDIAEIMGGFRIDDFIGGWDNEYLSSYESLNKLKAYYLQQYLGSFKQIDYMRLVKFFDQSLFRMIKDNVPARANAVVGVAIESDILSRSKINLLSNPPTLTNNSYTQSIQASNPEMTGSYSYHTGSINENNTDFITGSYSYYTSSNGIINAVLSSSYYNYSGAIDLNTDSTLSGSGIYTYTSGSSTIGQLSAVMYVGQQNNASVYQWTNMSYLSGSWNGSQWVYMTGSNPTWLQRVYQDCITGSRLSERLSVVDYYSGSTAILKKADVQEYKTIAMKNLYYLGCKLEASDFNVPSNDTPDGGPVVMFTTTNNNSIIVNPSPSQGNTQIID